MIVFSEIRAQAWKYSAIALAVLAVAVFIAAIIFRGSAIRADSERAVAHAERDQARAEVVSLKAAIKRDTDAAALADQARATVDDATAVSDARITQIKVKYRDRIVEVPAVCPVPDADLMRELETQAGRLSSSEDRLRGIRRTP